jgi:hypothetical protein
MATSELSLIASLTHVPSPDILSPSHIHVFPHSLLPLEVGAEVLWLI